MYELKYELKTGVFEGPLEKLLELIEAQKMDVGEVSMAKVTDDFLRYLETLRTAPEDLRVIADFIAIASRLIFLKSKYLLPWLELTDEEEADIKDLEDRLKRYQALKPAFRNLNRLWAERHTSYSRPYFLGRGTGLGPGQKVFYPPQDLTAADMASSLRRLLETIRTFELETQTVKETIVTLEEKITEVMSRVEREGSMRFGGGGSLDAATRSEMIVVFLAILHLAREQLIFLEQAAHFSDIMVKKK